MIRGLTTFPASRRVAHFLSGRCVFTPSNARWLSSGGEALLSRDFDIKLDVPAGSPLAAAQGALTLHCINTDDAQVVVDEVFDDALNGYFGKGGLTVPPPGSTILDVGANIGAFSVFISRVVPDCTVHAFEPMPDVYGALAANFADQSIRGTANNMGLSVLDCPDNITFTHYPNYPRCSTYNPEDKYRANFVPSLEPTTWVAINKGTMPELAAEVEALPESEARKRVKELVEWQFTEVEIEAKMTNIEKVVNERGLTSIDFLKIDVEGAELDVLLGISDTTWPMVQQIAAEVHDFDDRLNKVQDLLKAKGFTHVVAHGIDQYNEEFGMNHHFVYAARR